MPEPTPRSRPTIAYLACIATLAYIPIHVVWATGGTLLLPGGERTAALPGLRATNWVVSGLLLIGAIVVLGLARPWGRRLPPAALLVPVWIAAVVCLSHALFGFVTKGLYLAGVHGAVHFPPEAVATEGERITAAWLDLAVFEPWFLLEGVLLAAAGRQFLGTHSGRRRWTVAVVGGALLIALFGAALAINHLRFTID